MRPFILGLVVLFAIAALASGETYVVTPDGTGDFPTIQAAIDAAQDGDIIELTDGTFTGDGNRDVDFLGKVITVRSAAGDPTLCVIDVEGGPGPDRRRGFVFQNGESPNSVLNGLTVMNGEAPEAAWTRAGGAILCWNESSPTIENCIFKDNHAHDFEHMSGGGAIYSSSNPSLIGCVFVGNTADIGGALHGSYALISGCTFLDNVAEEYGGAVKLLQGEGLLENCTFARNGALYGGALHVAAFSLTVTNSVIAVGTDGGAIDIIEAEVTLSCCDIFGNEGGDWTGEIGDQLGINGNISEDPLFCAPDLDDFTLHADSPCAPDQNPECGLIGAWGVGCGVTPVEPCTWGGVKALFR